jgi:hypothetical protein
MLILAGTTGVCDLHLNNADNGWDGKSAECCLFQRRNLAGNAKLSGAAPPPVTAGNKKQSCFKLGNTK